MKPLIGMNLDIMVGPPRQVASYSFYHEAIVAAGGIPLLIPPVPENDLTFLFDRLDGLVLIGGDDYSPSLYGEEPHPKTSLVDMEREKFDLALIKLLLAKQSMPLLAICAGAQLLNVVMGGSLIQHIPDHMPESTVKHSGEAGWKIKDWHEVEILAGTKLFDIYRKPRINVATAHHQGFKDLGKDLVYSAMADDGIPEAVESLTHPFLIGVEWHPERNLENELPLFKAFIDYASKTAAKK
jgi:putative glutamine amidotransferase